MRSLVPIVLGCIVVLGLAAGTDAQAEPAKPKIESARPYIEQQCTHLSSTNPRVRYTAREALRNFGGQAVPLIKAAKDRTEDPNVKAFIDRVLVRVRTAGWLASQKKDPRARTSLRAVTRNRVPYDIDRIAMDINLTFEQIAKLDPILRGHFKELSALWQELRDAGATRDKEAYRELNHEVTLLVKAAEPTLRVFLNVKQTEYVKRLMLRLRSGGAYQVPVRLQAWGEDLKRRWENRGSLSEAELKALMEEYGEFKQQAYGKGGGGK